MKDPTNDTGSHFNWSRDCIYIALVLLGAGGAILIVISLSMIAFLVGEYKVKHGLQRVISQSVQR